VDVANTSDALGVILTAGAATRLRPLSLEFAKSLIPVLNRPLIDYALDLMAEVGVRDVAIVVGPDDEETFERAQARAPAGLSLRRAVQAEPRGNGDAVLAAGEEVLERTAVVHPVDAIMLGKVRPFLEHLLQRGLGADLAAGLMLGRVPNPQDFGVVRLDGDRIVELEEKPEHPRSDLVVSAPWILAPEVTRRLRDAPLVNAKGEVDTIGTVGLMVDEGAHVIGGEFDGRWLDVGTIANLLATQHELLAPLREAQIDESATVEASDVIAPAIVGAGARVARSLLEEVVVGEDATIEGSSLVRVMVAPGARLRGAALSDVVVTGSGEIVGPGEPTGGV
jgi:glucose-1-phosphate thymidylyltransferase